MNEQKEIADVVLDTPEPDKWIDCGESRPLPMFHMHTLMQYGERCAEAALAWLRSQGEPVAYRYKQISPFGNHEQLENWILIDVPARIDSWSSGHGVTPEPLFLAPQPVIPDGWQSVAARDVLSERRRQMEKEDWTLANDDEHRDGSMAQAAACYALGAATDNPDRHVMDRFGIEGTPYHIHSLWPWDRKWFKPHSRRRDLVKAGALILAEIERLDRRMLVTAPEPSK